MTYPGAWSGALLALASLLGACINGSPPVQSDSVAREDLHAVPIPEDWVVEGEPKARMKVLARAEDGALTAALWDCTSGTFHWFFSGDEFVHILEGEVTISREDGSGERTLRPGDVAYFQAGTHSIWRVDEYVKKVALFRDNHVGLVWRVRRKLGKIFSDSSEG